MVAGLSRQQIRLIKEKIAREGVSTAELAEDLLDHFCTCIEEEMEHGLCFEKALEKVFDNLEEDELKLTEMKTQELLEGKKVFYPDLWQTFDLMFVFVSGLLLLGPIAGYMLSKESAEAIRKVIIENLPLYITITNLILFGGVIGYAVLKIRKSQGKGPVFLFRSVPPYVYPVLACIFLLSQFWIEPLAMLSVVSPEKIMQMYEPLMKYGPITMILVMSFSAILAELLFRGIILKGLLKTMTPIKAILWSSVFFIAVNYMMPLYMFTMSLMLGWLYWKTKSLLPTIFVWVFGNVAAYCTLFFMGHWGELFTWKEWFGNLWLYVGVIAVSFLLTLGLFYYLHRKLSEKKQS